MYSNFKDAVQACHSDCFGVNKCPSKFNEMKCLYDLRQKQIEIDLEPMFNREKDAYIRNIIFHELRKQDITSTSDRILLSFIENFPHPSQNNVKINICEDCFRYLYQRKSKRTYEVWKSLMKQHIVSDRNAADIQARVKPLSARRNKNR